MKLIGNKESFAIEIADHSVGDMRVVDIWINGISICCDDNTVYLPQFIDSIDSSLPNDLDLNKYDKYFHGLSPEEIHSFIKSTRDEDSENYDVEDDWIYPHHQFLDWGATTDNVASFIFESNGETYVTFSFWREEHHNPEEINHIYKTTVDRIELRQVLSDAVSYLTSNKNVKL